jgi:hypothetical protein
LQNEFVGKVFGRLRVIAEVPHGISAVRLQCLCTCGNMCEAKAFQLRKGEKQSCGCLKRSVLGAATRTHGTANSRITGYRDRTYGIWQAMRDRCSNSNRKDWHCYGGKGIMVCASWQRYENFLADMGCAPTGLTLDRIDSNGNYCKDNCRWATRKEQSRNTSRIVWITHAGVTHSVGDWWAITGVKFSAYYGRLRRGWTREEALLLVRRKETQ